MKTNKLSNISITDLSAQKTEKKYEPASLNDNIEKYARNLNRLDNLVEEINETINRIETSITDTDIDSTLKGEIPCDPQLNNFYNCNEKLEILIREVNSIKSRLENLV